VSCIDVVDSVMGMCHSGPFWGGSSVNTTHDDSIRKNTIFWSLDTISPERHILRTFIHLLFPVEQRDPSIHNISSKTTI